MKKTTFTLKKLTTALAMAFVMLFITIMVLAVKAEFSNLTLALVMSVAAIYGLREVFKDDVKRLLWRRVRKGRPKWSQDLKDPNSKQHIAKQVYLAGLCRRSRYSKSGEANFFPKKNTK